MLPTFFLAPPRFGGASLRSNPPPGDDYLAVTMATGHVAALVPQAHPVGEVVDDVAKLAVVLGREGELVAGEGVVDEVAVRLDVPREVQQELLHRHVEAQRLLC